MEPPIPRDQPPPAPADCLFRKQQEPGDGGTTCTKEKWHWQKKNGVQTSTTTASAPVLEQEADLDAPAGKRSDGGGK